MTYSKDNKDNIKLAISSILLASLALSAGDAIIKSLSVSFSIWQVFVIRSSIAIALLIILIKYRTPNQSLVPLSIPWATLRSVLLAFTWICYYLALPHLKLSVIASAIYTTPLFITLFSALVNGEKVTQKSWIAMFIGFSGVLLISRPDSSGFNAYIFSPLLGAILYALAMILTRSKCLDEKPKTLALSFNIVFLIIGLLASLLLVIWSPSESYIASNPFLLGAWISLETSHWLAMVALAVFFIIGNIFVAVAYQNGPSSTVAAFDYSYLVFSILWGWTIFAESLGVLDMLGIAMIAIAGITAVRR